MDVVFPSKNEKEFLEKKKELLFVYPYDKHFKSPFNFVLLTDKKIKDPSIYKACGNDRGAFEFGVSYVYNLEASKERDFIFSRRSGMNQVLAKIAKKNGITICFSFNLFVRSSSPAKILGRMQHNMKLCEKYKVKTLVASFAKKPDEVISDITLQAFERLLKKRNLF